MNYKDRIIIRTYTNFGIGVTVKIDFDKKTISLVDDQFKPKNWKFSDRTIDYMQGWKNILTAIEMAIDEASEDLTIEIEKEKNEFVEKVAKISSALEEEKEND